MKSSLARKRCTVTFTIFSLINYKVHFKLQKSLFGLLQEMSRDDKSLNLSGALINLENLCIPHEFLDRIFRVKTSTSKYLQEKSAVNYNARHVIVTDWKALTKLYA